MKTSWESFMNRRNIDLTQFLLVNCIKTRIEFIAHLAKIGVEPPDEVLIKSLFPAPLPIVLEVTDQTSFDSINKSSKYKNKNG